MFGSEADREIAELEFQLGQARRKESERLFAFEKRMRTISDHVERGMETISLFEAQLQQLEAEINPLNQATKSVRTAHHNIDQTLQSISEVLSILNTATDLAAQVLLLSLLNSLS